MVSMTTDRSENLFNYSIKNAQFAWALSLVLRTVR